MVIYQWRELELLTLTTASNIISAIQFGILPLDFANSESEVQNENSIDKIEKFLSINLKAFNKLLTTPFELIRAYYSISAPIRASLTATIAFAAISFLYSIFFFTILSYYNIFNGLDSFCGISFWYRFHCTKL